MAEDRGAGNRQLGSPPEPGDTSWLVPTTPDPSPWLNQRHDRLAGEVERLREAGQFAECARVLAERGAALLAVGGAATIVATVRALPKETRPAGLMLVYGDALRYRGESDAALEVYARLAEAGAEQTAGLAWRVGLIHYLCGEPERALAAYGGARLGTERSLDEAVLLAWTATAFWMVGDAAGCADRAERARRAAEAVGDDGVRAGAHIALALLASLTGDLAGNQEHYDRALRLAESAADAMQATRIHSNRAGCLLDEGRYVEALNEARSAVVMAERTGYEAFLGTALVNEGEALDRLGHLAEAVARYERAVPIFQRMGSRKAAYPLVGLGEAYRRWGRLAQARASYERGLRTMRDDRNLQVLVPALAGLARSVSGTEPALAEDLVARALAAATGPTTAAVQLALGCVALSRGDRRAATRAAEVAAASARLHGDPVRLAESLELAASAADDPAQARTALTEARFIYAERGARLDTSRVLVLVGRLADATEAERVEGRLAAQRLAEAGIMLPTPPEPAAVRVRTLGRFEVQVAGRPVAASAWQSRKARDLLRILLSRRGRAVPREELADLLWPGEGTARVANRLSVALSTVRTVLDPHRGRPADHFLVADQASVALDLGRVNVDAFEFAAEAEHGLKLLGRDDPAGALAALSAAVRRYVGDFLADEPYHEWAAPLREELRSLYLRATRALVTVTLGAGDNAEAARCLHRILDVDPYDEQGHLGLIDLHLRNGHHGEARRAYRRYAEAMRDLGVRPQPPAWPNAGSRGS